jgi:endonuclease YncB( thermonuclease family)
MSRIHIYQAKIVEVVDGDTFDLMIDLGFNNFTKQRMRLYGIDAPEMRTQFRDKYGRFLAIVYDAWPIASLAFVNGEKILEVAPLSLNARLINDGLVKERYW